MEGVLTRLVEGRQPIQKLYAISMMQFFPLGKGSQRSPNLISSRQRRSYGLIRSVLFEFS